MMGMKKGKSVPRGLYMKSENKVNTKKQVGRTGEKE